MPRPPRRPTRLLVLAMAALLAIALVGCASSSPSESADGAGSGRKVSLTIYSGQHEELVDKLTAAFTAKTGITFNIRSGDDAELVNQIAEEGDKTKADLYLSEEPGPVGSLATKDLLSPIPADVYAQVDQRLVPSTHNWLPYSARVRVLYYDPALISPEELPHSILDLTQPQWKGKFAYAPSGAFAATVSYLAETIGADKTLAWLKGIKANGVNEQSNGKVRDTVEAGQHPFGLSNHYYWWRLAQTKGGPQHLTSKIAYFDHPDAGGLILASGAAVLKSSPHQGEAQQFRAWQMSPTGGQAIVGGSDAANDGAQFPVAKGVNSKIAGMPPLASLQAPDADQAIFADTTRATKLIEQAGIS